MRTGLFIGLTYLIGSALLRWRLRREVARATGEPCRRALWGLWKAHKEIYPDSFIRPVAAVWELGGLLLLAAVIVSRNS